MPCLCSTSESKTMRTNGQYQRELSEAGLSDRLSNGLKTPPDPREGLNPLPKHNQILHASSCHLNAGPGELHGEPL